MAADLNAQPLSADDVSREELDRAFREVLALSSGKRVLFWMLEQCGVYQDAFTGEAMASTNYSLGRQSVGRVVIGKLDEIDARNYPQLLLAIAELREIDKGHAAVLARKQLKEDDNEE